MIIELSNYICIDNITYLRRKYAISRRGLARLAGISEYLLRDMEAHIYPPIFQQKELLRICAIFDVSMENLIHKDLSATK